MYIQLSRSKPEYGDSYISTMTNDGKSISCLQTYWDAFDEYLRDFKSDPEKYLVLEEPNGKVKIFEK